MSDNWIYVGADFNNHQWSKIGKTTKGLHTRHTSSQNPGYFIFTAYNIISGNVHAIEEKILNHIESLEGVVRQIHMSTGSKSECFFVNPFLMSNLVESFIEKFYPSSVYYENLVNGLSRYQCDDNVYWSFNPDSQPVLVMPEWCNEPHKNLPENFNLSKVNYFTGNKVKYEEDLGEGLFIDYETGMQGFRGEDGYIDWHQWK